MKKDDIKVENEYAIINVNPNIYSLNVVRSAAYVFMDRAYVIIDGDPKSQIVVKLKPKNKEDVRKLGLDFYNELLSYAHYSDRVKDNIEIIKMILQRALFSADKTLVDEIEEREVEEILKELDKEDQEITKEIKRLKMEKESE